MPISYPQPEYVQTTDPVAKTVTRTNLQGTTLPGYPRAMTADEVAALAQQQAEEALAAKAQAIRQQVAAGIADLDQVRKVALADKVTAATTVTNGKSLSTQIATLQTQAAAFKGSTTYSAAQITQITGALAQTLGQLKAVTDALIEVLQWRQAVDQNVAQTAAIEAWLGQTVSATYDRTIEGA